MRDEQERYNRSGFGRWSWLSAIDKLAQGDITKHEEIYKTNFISCLNLLSFWKERDKELKRQEEENKK